MFSQLVKEKLGYYVYGLKDPRNNKYFYIGKGTGNRAFAHVEEALRGRGKKLDKIGTIQSIISSGYKLEPIIIRHGLDEDTAFELESALIDIFGLENLANIKAGHKSDRGIMTAAEIQLKYDAEKLTVDDNTKILLVCINGSYKKDMSEEELYKITKGNWLCNINKAKQCNYVLGVYHGLVKTIYVPEQWDNIKDSNGVIKRHFEGYVPENYNEFIDKDVSSYLKNNQWSFRYINLQ
jgi:uncharacterized protein